jgi:hypothetical protein
MIPSPPLQKYAGEHRRHTFETLRVVDVLRRQTEVMG